MKKVVARIAREMVRKRESLLDLTCGALKTGTGVSGERGGGGRSRSTGLLQGHKSIHLSGQTASGLVSVFSQKGSQNLAKA